MREGWGLSITEANARGTPAIAYDLPGVRDAVRHQETGFLVEQNDWLELGLAASVLFADDTLMRKTSTAALGFASQFAWDRTCSAFAEMCNISSG